LQIERLEAGQVIAVIICAGDARSQVQRGQTG
jgi:hypothetical protein